VGNGNFNLWSRLPVGLKIDRAFAFEMSIYGISAFKWKNMSNDAVHHP
jgi:hypothetical protein